MRRAALALFLAASSLSTAAPPLAAPALGAGPAASPDFNGDGRSDLAVGAPQEPRGGAVHVVYGAGFGLRSSDDDWWHQDATGVPGIRRTGDEFGAATAAGDFDADGYDDLAIGVPGDQVGGVEVGTVVVLYGGTTGLTASGAQLFHEGSPSIGGSVRAGNRFGATLAAGDFDGDGDDDLAIGSPGEKVRVGSAGGVQVLYGGPAGLTTAGAGFWHHDSDGVPGSSRNGARLGDALAAGDFDADGFDDLAAGAPGYALGGRARAGSVLVLPGSAAGLQGTGSQLWHHDQNRLPGASQVGAQFGAALAAGDLDGDGRADLAIGAPGTKVSGHAAAGRVAVVYGAAHLLGSAGIQVFHQASSGVAGAPAAGDAFGGALAVTNLGDLAGGSIHLAVGAPGEVTGRSREVGAVHVFAGSGAGVVRGGSLYLREGREGLPPQARAGERFGDALAGGDFDGDGFGDLAIGVPGDRVGSVSDAGSVVVFYGWATPLDGASGAQVVHLDQPGIRGTARTGDGFGAALAAGGA